MQETKKFESRLIPLVYFTFYVMFSRPPSWFVSLSFLLAFHHFVVVSLTIRQTHVSDRSQRQIFPRHEKNKIRNPETGIPDENNTERGQQVYSVPVSMLIHFCE